MNPPTLWGRLSDAMGMVPIAIAYRLIWLAARLRLGSARDVYSAMWDANLALPPLKGHSSRDTNNVG